MRKLIFTVLDGEKGGRLDKFLFNCWQKNIQKRNISNISRSGISQLIQSGFVLLNNKKITKPAHLVNNGEVYLMQYPSPRPMKLQGIDLNLEILFEDKDIAVIVKPAGISVHPEEIKSNQVMPMGSIKKNEPTLVEGLLFALKNLSGINGVYRPGIIHRLDKKTEGLMVIAKSNEAHINLSREFASRRIKKKYRAIVRGELGIKKAVLEAFIVRDPGNRIKMKVFTGDKDNHPWKRQQRAFRPKGRIRKIKTGYKVIKEIKLAEEIISLLEIDLYTGRTHQIRAHLQSLGYPVLGDTLYSGKKATVFENMFLQAFYLGFYHPIGGNWLEFQLDMPARFKEILQKSDYNANQCNI